MRACTTIRTFLLAMLGLVSAFPHAGYTGPATTPPGLHDFDFVIGSWKTRIKHVQRAPTGSTAWTEIQGSIEARAVWGGRSNLQEIEIDKPSGPFMELRLCLFNTQTHEWYLYWADAGDGILAQPMIGSFKDGTGSFYDQEDINGKTLFVRQTYTDITADSYHWEQAFSGDGGKTWETNWVVTVTRQAGTAASP